MFQELNSRCNRFFRYIDQFSIPFEFNIENNHKKKQTEIGGILTFIVYSISITYMIYHVNLYFNGRDPQISISKLTSIENFYDIDEDALGFGFFIVTENEQIKSLIDLESETGKLYFIFKTQYQYFDDNGVYHVQNLEQKPCQTSSNLQGYLCFDFSQYDYQKIQLKFNFQSSGFKFEGISIFVERCENQLGLNCADSQEIDKLTYSQNNQIKVSLKTSRFNTFNNQQETYYVGDSFSLDTSIGLYKQYQLIQSKTTYINGMLFQNKIQTQYLDSFEQLQEVHSVENFKLQQKPLLKSFMRFKLSQEMKNIHISYPLITETLAHCLSLFGVMLIFGQFGRRLSEIQLYQVYYKRTANTLLKYLNETNSQQKMTKQKTKNSTDKKPSNLSQIQISTQMKTISQEEKIIQQQINNEKDNSQQEIEEILRNYKNINQTYFPNIFRKVFKLSIFQKLYVLFKKKVPKSSLKKNSEELKHVNNIIENTKKMNNIYDFIKEFIKIKMIVRFLLSKEQYAAIQFCGVDVQNVNDLLQKKLKYVPQFRSQNYKQLQLSKQREDGQLKNDLKNTDQNTEQFPQNQSNDKQPQIFNNGMSSLQQLKQNQQQNDENLQQRNSTFIFTQRQDTLFDKSKQDTQQNVMTTNPTFIEKSSEIILQIKDQNNQENRQSSKQNDQINHLEILEGIDKDEDYLNLYLENFIHQIKNNNYQSSELDQRIYQCIVQSNQSEQ